MAPKAHKVERETRLLQIVLPTSTGAYLTPTGQINDKTNLLYLTKLTRRNLNLFLDFLNNHMLRFDQNFRFSLAAMVCRELPTEFSSCTEFRVFDGMNVGFIVSRWDDYFIPEFSF